jgi:hypothetical protein
MSQELTNYNPGARITESNGPGRDKRSDYCYQQTPNKNTAPDPPDYLPKPDTRTENAFPKNEKGHERLRIMIHKKSPSTKQKSSLRNDTIAATYEFLRHKIHVAKTNEPVEKLLDKPISRKHLLLHPA